MCCHWRLITDGRFGDEVFGRAENITVCLVSDGARGGVVAATNRQVAGSISDGVIGIFQ